jgi:Mor family transcriptional regulator
MSDSIIVRVTLDSYDFAHPAEKQTQVYVQIPEVARASWLLSGEMYHFLKSEPWPNVVDAAQEDYVQRCVVSDSASGAARAAVVVWLLEDANHDAMQAAWELDQARQHPVARKLLAENEELKAQRERRRVELVALRNDALSMRGSLSPNGEGRKVPFPLGESLTPAVDWLIARVAELEAERHTTNEALDDAVQALREQQDRFETLRALCDAAEHVGIVSGGWFTVEAVRRAAAGEPLPKPDGITRRIAPSQALREMDGEHYPAVHHDYRTSRDLPEMGGAR